VLRTKSVEGIHRLMSREMLAEVPLTGPSFGRTCAVLEDAIALHLLKSR